MTKFTPGPWTVGRDGYNACMVYGHSEGVCQVFDLPLNVRIDEVGTDWAEGLANARLISSAPELYEALESCLAFLEDDEIADGRVLAVDMARAALSKAEGGT